MIENLTKKDLKLYNEFINEVFGYDSSLEHLEKYIKENKVLIVKKDSRIAASVSIKEEYDYIKDQKYYYINYLGVLKDYRREGLASKLFDEIDRMAQENNIMYLLLTSGNQRRAAHFFYKSRNFKIKDTTVFIKLYTQD